MQRIRDFLLEGIIESVRIAFVHGPRRTSIPLQRLFIRLIHCRSDEQVARMEGRFM